MIATNIPWRKGHFDVVVEQQLCKSVHLMQGYGQLLEGGVVGQIKHLQLELADACEQALELRDVPGLACATLGQGLQLVAAEPQLLQRFKQQEGVWNPCNKIVAGILGTVTR